MASGRAGRAGGAFSSLRGRMRLLLRVAVLALVLHVIAAAGVAWVLDRNLDERRATDRLQGQLVAFLGSVLAEAQDVNRLVLTGDPAAQDAYAASREVTRARLDALADVTGGDEAIQRAIRDVEYASAAWDAQVALVVGAAERGDPAASVLLTGRQGQAVVDAVRNAVAGLQDAVADRAAAGTRDARLAWQLVLVLLPFTVAASAALLAVAARFAHRGVTAPLGRLVDDVQTVAGGDLEHVVSGQGAAELRDLGRAVNAMRLRLLDERALAARRSLLVGQEDERRRLASGIHDDTIQAVLAASLRLQRLRRRLRDHDDEAVELVGEVQQDLEEAIGRLRRLVFELHPPTLDRDGLEAAMRLYLEETLAPAGIDWTLRTDGELPRDQVAAALAYRLFREAVLNVLRHSGARRVEVGLSGQDGEVEVVVADDGVGFDPPGRQPAPGHLGLVASRQLCEAAGGRWKVDSAPGAGTRVRYAVPATWG